MGRLIDADSAYTVLTDYYHHKTDVQHMALKDALDKVETVDAIPVDYLTSRISRLRQHKTYAGDFAADLLEAIIKGYNKEVHNGKTE